MWWRQPYYPALKSGVNAEGPHYMRLPAFLASLSLALAVAAAQESADGVTVDVDLRKLAVARSGDKGNASNIAIIARKPDYVPILRREVTPEKIAAHFEGLVHGKVQRFEAPGLHAFNFLLDDALGGGGMASRRIDPQGKAFGQMALEMKIKVPRALAQELEQPSPRSTKSI